MVTGGVFVTEFYWNGLADVAVDVLYTRIGDSGRFDVYDGDFLELVVIEKVLDEVGSNKTGTAGDHTVFHDVSRILDILVLD